jgi:two-component system phosphate regulon response regulator PhoB
MTSWMVVEDEPDLYEMLMAMTEIVGVDGVAFTTGEDALTWIEAVDGRQIQHERPELALLDIRLPGQNSGLEVCKRLRSSPVLGDILVVLMTAYHVSPREEREMLRQSGADVLLRKPFPNLKALSKLLQDHLQRRAKRRRSQPTPKSG